MVVVVVVVVTTRSHNKLSKDFGYLAVWRVRREPSVLTIDVLTRTLWRPNQCMRTDRGQEGHGRKIAEKGPGPMS